MREIVTAYCIAELMLLYSSLVFLPRSLSYVHYVYTSSFQSKSYGPYAVRESHIYRLQYCNVNNMNHRDEISVSLSKSSNFDDDQQDDYDDELDEKRLDTFESFQDYTYDVGDEDSTYFEYIQLEDIMADMDNPVGPDELSDYLSIGMFDPDDDSIDEKTMQELLSLPDAMEPEDLEDLERLFSDQGWALRDYDEKGGVTTFERPLRVYSPSSPLEQALLQGVVPVDAGVGSLTLPGDYGFDPLGFSTKDYFKQSQSYILNMFPRSESDDDYQADQSYMDSQRPSALILRDYREAEIRHGRLAMLAAVLWPLQEILDKLFMPTIFGDTTFVYGGPTLPFLSLLMTFMMLLLGYLDVYATAIKTEYTGDAFLPGECFWDPLSILEGATMETKRTFQARELFLGRMAMVAFLSYVLQEAITHSPLITLPWNTILFEPVYEIPSIQLWLDTNFGGIETPSIEDFSSIDDTDVEDNLI